jgi:DHA1 family multidrug resistance protein-like MFS transporter
MTLLTAPGRLRAWIARWRPVLPLFGAEVIVWVGFGALLPVLPLYFTEQGVDLATLGVVIAAWPAARLIGEPVFGWVADRTRRVPLMVSGLGLTGAFLALPLVIHGPVAFLVLRGLAGLATSIYDPAARGVLMDATNPDQHGEAFGWYGAAQMSGLLLGPAIGGVGASLFGGIGFVFVFGAVSALASAVVVGLTVRDVPRRSQVPVLTATGLSDFHRDFPPIDDGRPAGASGVAGPVTDGGDRADLTARPRRLRNPLLGSAVITNATDNFGAGTYDTIWSIYLTSKGATLGLVSLTFTMFAVPVLVVGPFAGRIVDRRGAMPFLIIGMVVIAIAAFLYTILPDPAWAVPVILFDATGFAILNPAVYAVVGRGSPDGRTSSAQGIFGAAGTLGFVVSALIAGSLAAIDLRYPFYLFGVVTLVGLGLTLLVGGRSIRATEPGALPVEPAVASVDLAG